MKKLNALFLLVALLIGTSALADTPAPTPIDYNAYSVQNVFDIGDVLIASHKEAINTASKATDMTDIEQVKALQSVITNELAEIHYLETGKDELQAFVQKAVEYNATHMMQSKRPATKK